jgi:hypothetical protein
MLYQQFSDIFTAQEQSAIDQEILGNDFPWFYQAETTRIFPQGDLVGIPDPWSYHYLSHTLVHRSGTGMGQDLVGTVNSKHWMFFQSIFLRTLDTQGIKIDKILRASLNCSFDNNMSWGRPHVDHNFPHQNFIAYLNHFNEGSTYLFESLDPNSQQVAVIPGQQGSAAVFSGVPHSQGFCKAGERRVVLVVTFN